MWGKCPNFFFFKGSWSLRSPVLGRSGLAPPTSPQGPSAAAPRSTSRFLAFIALMGLIWELTLNGIDSHISWQQRQHHFAFSRLFTIIKSEFTFVILPTLRLFSWIDPSSPRCPGDSMMKNFLQFHARITKLINTLMSIQKVRLIRNLESKTFLVCRNPHNF